MDKAQYLTLQQKIKAGTATPEEIQAVKDYDAAMEKKPEQPQTVGDYWGTNVAEDTIAKHNGQTSDDIASQRLTKEQQGIQAKGNPGDNAPANPNALNSAEIDQLHKAELASAQTPENMNPSSFSPDSKIREEALANKSPEVEAVTSVAQPKESDTPEVKGAKGKYNKSMMSIWDAYNEGLIDKETAGYFAIDAIATLAKNLGRSIGNVGAQFTGGTIDQGHDESKWEERRDRLFGEETEMEAEGMGGPSGRKAEMENLDIAAKRIRNEYTPEQLETQLGLLQKELEMADINVNLAGSKTDIINHIKSDPNYSNDPIKMGIVAYLSQAGMAGTASAAGNTLANAANWILTLAK